MAGAGYKLFNTGDVLTAAQVNTYLQEQAVMRFASAAARTTALSGVLAEGMVSYLMDTNAVEVYDGSAWVGVGNVGDITGVTAGTGISGGGTSGTVTITNSMATEITAAGDIIVGTGSGTFDNLPIGTTGQVLTADTTVSPYKVKWATASSGGMTLLSTTSLSGATTTITISDFTYQQLFIRMTGATNATADGKWYIKINNSTTNFYNTITGRYGDNAQNNYNSNNYMIETAVNDRTNANNVWTTTIDNYASSSTYKNVSSQMFFDRPSGGFYSFLFTGTINSNSQISSIVIGNDGGNANGGTVLVYGVK